MKNPFTIVVGYGDDYPIQIRLKGSGANATLAFDDIVVGALYPHNNGVASCTPTISFYTAGSTQTGYDQGQVVASYSTADAQAVSPSIQYYLLITRARAASPTVFNPIAIVPFSVVQPQFPRI